MTRARRAPRTTEPDPAAARAPDLVGRQWRVSAPNLLLVADFTYVPMTRGFGYTAFVVDAYAGLIPGWECSLGQGHRLRRACAAPRRCRTASAGRAPVRRRDPSFRPGSQYTAIHYGETLMLGRTATVGRDRRRRPRQCVVRDDDRAVQDRVHPRRLPVPQRPDQHPGRPGGHHIGVGQAHPATRRPAHLRHAHAPGAQRAGGVATDLNTAHGGTDAN